MYKHGVLKKIPYLGDYSTTFEIAESYVRHRDSFGEVICVSANWEGERLVAVDEFNAFHLGSEIGKFMKQKSQKSTLLATFVTIINISTDTHTHTHSLSFSLSSSQ